MSPTLTLRRNLAVRFALIRQRSPYVFRDMLAKASHKRELAQEALLDAIEWELQAFEITEREKRKDTLHATW